MSDDDHGYGGGMGCGIHSRHCTCEKCCPPAATQEQPAGSGASENDLWLELAKILRFEKGDDGDWFIPAEPQPLGPFFSILQAAIAFMRFMDATDKAMREEIEQLRGSPRKVGEDGALQVTLETVFDEEHQDSKWRNAVAEQLNTLLTRAKYCADTTNDESDKDVERATLAIVERVATFEGIRARSSSVLCRGAAQMKNKKSKRAWEKLVKKLASKRCENCRGSLMGMVGPYCSLNCWRDSQWKRK